MSKASFKSNRVEDTIEFGRQLGKKLKAGDVVALRGPLGSGKTHLVKGIAEALNIEKSVVHSPTYSLIHEYEGRIPLYHFDCYRMKSVNEALQIGAEDYIFSDGICVIEWPEIIETILPEEVLWVNLKATGKNKRVIEVKEKWF